MRYHAHPSFNNPKGRLVVRLNSAKEDGTPNLGNLRKFNQVGFEGVYFPHPDPKVDLACINASAITHTDIYSRSLSDVFLKPIDYNKVILGSEIIFIGYPRGFYDVVNNLPLLRKGVIASVPNVDFNGKGQVVIDAHIFPGSSGSPVFVNWDGSYSLLGVISGGVRRYAELEEIPTNMPPVGVEQMVGLGIVVKQRHVQELIDYTVGEYRRRKSSSS